jgi:hypothetical protein
MTYAKIEALFSRLGSLFLWLLKAVGFFFCATYMEVFADAALRMASFTHAGFQGGEPPQRGHLAAYIALNPWWGVLGALVSVLLAIAFYWAGSRLLRKMF